ncbi:phage major capsid protein [Loigolactobacillus backii]|uniref:phage major capsid protein n=1 Tax=Loigolactobacillus backii TaxID=375175 RepID=UPI0022FD8C41|nr:phage major capsid protein [Loigolactobacillus backii]MDA5386520.1 phage major capsid protein [Loigolactobacillus backii]MDA5389047.1 phage major capsid protein [Loigolactobacillus backii]
MLKQTNDVNTINDAWIAKGQSVSDLNAKLNAAVLDDNFKEDDYKDLKTKRDNAAAQRDALKDQLENARAAQVASMVDNDKEKLSKDELSTKDKFVSDFKAMVNGDPKIMNLVTSSTDADGKQIGLTIPQDIQTAINTLVRQYDALEQYVNREATTMPTGSRVWEKWTDVTPLADLDDETATIGDNDDPKLTTIKYLIHRYAGITTITNTLLKDTADNILTWLSQWIAKKVVVTRNLAILKVFNTAKKVPLAKFDDIKDLELTTLDPALLTTSEFITNQSGLGSLAKVKNAMGGYMLQRDVTLPDQWTIGGKVIHVVSDRWLPDVNTGTADAPANVHPLYFGDGKQFATLFDREQMSLLTTNIGGGAFENDSTKIRVIDRFDVEATDTESMVMGTFTTIADQPGNLQAASK